MSIIEPPAAPHQTNSPPSLAYAAGRSVKRSPLLWFFGAIAVFALLLVVGVVAVIAAFNAGRSTASRADLANGSSGSSFSSQSSLPLVPVTVTIRKALMGEGYVCNFMNDGERHLKFTVLHKRESLKQQDSFSMRLDPGQSQEVGWAENRVFYPGDVIEIQHPDFRSREWQLNPR